MALVLPHSIFFHIGRTAGHCVRKTIREMGIPTYEVGRFHDWPSNIQLNDEDRKKLSFCFVRHPLAWLRSFWCHEMQFGWSESDYTSKTRSDSFTEFLTKALEAYPDGPAWEVFRPFVRQCREVGRQENLTGDLRRILDRAGEQIDPRVIALIRPTGVEIERQIRDAATAPRALLDKVLACERDICGQFGYADVPAGMVGPPNVCLAAYVPLGESEKPFTLEGHADDGQGVMNSFLLNGKRISGPRHGHRQTMMIQRVWEQVEFRDKAVVEIGYEDGVFCFFAESQTAARVVGIDIIANGCAERLSRALASNVEFLRSGHYGVEQSIGGGFDIALCRRRLHEARHPLLLIRTLSRLLKDGGTLVLATPFVDIMAGVPVHYMPIGSETPFVSSGCTCFNKKGLLNALATYGFQDVVIHSTLEAGVDSNREFARMPFGASRTMHDSESSVGFITLTCTLDPAAADRDPRYALDGMAGQELVNYWDIQFPVGTRPECQATQAMMVEYAEIGMRSRLYKLQLKDQLATATAAILDRDRELVETRRLLEERTALLEQLHADIASRTADLVETRQLLLDRTARLEQAIAELESGGGAVRPEPID